MNYSEHNTIMIKQRQCICKLKVLLKPPKKLNVYSIIKIIKLFTKTKFSFCSPPYHINEFRDFPWADETSGFHDLHTLMYCFAW